MVIPDYVHPIIGYRRWLWNGSRLLSLNGQPWNSGCPLTARCNALAARCNALATGGHQAPQIHCTCGIYALKAPLPARDTGWPSGHGPSGEVYLWGTVVEHSDGWRAQYAYPKTLVVTSTCDPLGLDGGRGSLSAEEVQSRLEGLTKYRADIVSANGIPVWTTRSGYNPAGIKRLRKITPCLLNPRELELLPLFCQGLTNREICMRLGLSEFSVKSYLFRIFDKLGVSTRLELAYLVMSSPTYQGLIKPQTIS